MLEVGRESAEHGAHGKNDKTPLENFLPTIKIREASEREQGTRDRQEIDDDNPFDRTEIGPEHLGKGRQRNIYNTRIESCHEGAARNRGEHPPFFGHIPRF